MPNCHMERPIISCLDLRMARRSVNSPASFLLLSFFFDRSIVLWVGCHSLLTYVDRYLTTLCGMFTYITYARSSLSMDYRPQLLSTAMSPATWPPTPAAVSFSMVHTATDCLVRSSLFFSTIQVQLRSDPYCCHLDLYSRGYSVGPAVDHTPVFYVTQLHELLKHVGWTRCNFVGLSLGGGIVAAYAHRFPEAVLSLNFVAPAGLLSVSSLCQHDRSMPMNQNKGKTYFPTY